MIQVRKSMHRGHAKQGWLDSYHTFSFGNYYDPNFTGFRVLWVINEDRVQPSNGFGLHGHQNMEIISYVLEGQLEHKDSMGSGSVLKYGDAQRMSAGTGVRHSEFNPSRNEWVHFLQIWISPKKQNIDPSYEEKHFPLAKKQNRLQVIASPDGRDASLTINQNALLYATILEPNQTVTCAIAPGRYAWIQVARGSSSVNGVTLSEGDGAAISDEQTLEVQGITESEVLVFDLP